MWRIHRHIGMGGDQLVSAVTDASTEQQLGNEIRSAQSSKYADLIEEVAAMDGARKLLEQLHRRGHRVVLASSAKQDEVDHYLDLLDARDLAETCTTSADVEATKPEPDIVETALASVAGDPDDAVMVGDSRWDVEAAKRADVRCLAVRTGGFGVDELRDAGAIDVFASVRELCERLTDTPFA